jgi:glycosyltransferase involved in cell wall biosynthesis
MRISVFIIAKNEEARINRAINSVIGWVDEVIVIDSNSTDNTADISKSLGARVINNHWSGYVAQKIFGEQQCRNDWILNIDADEEVSEELKKEIQQSACEYKAYYIDIVNIHRCTNKPQYDTHYHSAIRFYNRHYASFNNRTKDSLYHDTVILNEGVMAGKINSKIWHRSITSIEQAIAKLNNFTSIQAKEMLANKRNPNKIRLILEFFISFLKAYIIRRYFLYGIPGFSDSIIFAFSRYIRLAKAYELFLDEDGST